MCEKLSDTAHPQGVFAVLPLPRTDAAEAIAAAAKGFPLFALHGAADPGNLGTIMRTTEWFGGTSLLLSTDSVDPFNPKVLRSSMGSLFRLHLGRYPSLEWLIEAAAKNGRTLVATTAEEGIAPRAYPHFASSIILLGSEAHGLSQETLGTVSRRLTIPGNGAESLNLAMAHAVLAYEASLR
jgi:TrmH family RNA methyltransferase